MEKSDLMRAFLSSVFKKFETKEPSLDNTNNTEKKQESQDYIFNSNQQFKIVKKKIVKKKD